MGRYGKILAKGNVGVKPASPESPVEKAIVDSVSPFGAPVIVSQSEKKEARKGIPMEMLQEKNIESGYVHPEQRMNPDYHAKAVADKEKREKEKRSMGYNQGVILVGASANSPQGGKQLNW